jgi:hypothetical protein
VAFGADQPVKAVFAVYKDAMEAQALALMGRKMRAAQLCMEMTSAARSYPWKKAISSPSWRVKCCAAQS